MVGSASSEPSPGLPPWRFSRGASRPNAHTHEEDRGGSRPLQGKRLSARPVIFQPPINPSATECGLSMLAATSPPRCGHSLQTRHPQVLPPCSRVWVESNCHPHPHPRLVWSWHMPRAERSVSDVLRLLSPHKDWKLSLLSPWRPAPNQ